MTTRLVLLLAIAFSLASGCGTATAPSDAASGGDAATGDAATGSDAATGNDAASLGDAATSDAGSTTLGDCSSDADCPGGHCVPITPGGYRVCQTPPVESTMCQSGRPDDCCTTADCATGACFLGPIRHFCGGPVQLERNECASDECTSDATCTSGSVCAPAGTLAPVRVCAVASCHTDADCTAEAGGHCVLARDPCCDVATTLACTYPSDGCRSASDCPGGYCAIEAGRTHCETGGPTCPL